MTRIEISLTPTTRERRNADDQNTTKMRIFLVFRTQTVNAAIAEAERIRLIGGAEAQALEAVGMSEAERMRMKAAVYKKYGEAAILNIALNALPKVRDRDDNSILSERKEVKILCLVPRMYEQTYYQLRYVYFCRLPRRWPRR